MLMTVDSRAINQWGIANSTSVMIYTTRQIIEMDEMCKSSKIKEGICRVDLTMCRIETTATIISEVLLRVWGGGKAHRDGFHAALQHHGVSLGRHSREGSWLT